MESQLSKPFQSAANSFELPLRSESPILPTSPTPSSTTKRLTNRELADLSAYRNTDLHDSIRESERQEAILYKQDMDIRKESAAWQDTQEIRSQARPALSELSKLNPSSPTYKEDRDSIFNRYPMAALDDAVKSVDTGKNGMFDVLNADKIRQQGQEFTRETQQIGYGLQLDETKYKYGLERESASDNLKTQMTGSLMKLSPQAREQHQQLVAGGMDQRDALLKVEADNKDYIASSDAKEARAGMNKSQAQVARANAEISKIKADPMLSSSDQDTMTTLLKPHLDAIAEARDSYDFDKHILDTYMAQRGIDKPKKDEAQTPASTAAPAAAPTAAPTGNVIPVTSLIPKNREITKEPAKDTIYRDKDGQAYKGKPQLESL